MQVWWVDAAAKAMVNAAEPVPAKRKVKTEKDVQVRGMCQACGPRNDLSDKGRNHDTICARETGTRGVCARAKSSDRDLYIRRSHLLLHTSPLVARTMSHTNLHGQQGPGQEEPYALCSKVPLIKSPAVRVPAPVSLPTNIHPLPPNLQEYFVYPFSLEHFVLDAADRRERQRQEDLRKRAPGWSEHGGVLQPTRRNDAHHVPDVEVDEMTKMLDRLEQS